MNNQKNFDLDYFINKFESIPDRLWTTGYYRKELGQCCAYGHCGVVDQAGSPEGDALQRLFPGQHDVVKINDGWHPEYSQGLPKARILAALKDLKDGKFKGY